MLAVGTFMFGRGWMGGGDIKLLAASALWFDLSDGWKLLVAVAIAGGMETLISHAASPAALAGRRSAARPCCCGGARAIPYGIAIALGVALMAWWLR